MSTKIAHWECVRCGHETDQVPSLSWDELPLCVYSSPKIDHMWTLTWVIDPKSKAYADRGRVAGLGRTTQMAKGTPTAFDEEKDDGEPR